MKADLIRCDGDNKLFNRLLENNDVKKVRQQIERLEEKQGGHTTRRHLLATSVRLSRSMAPELHHMADHCVERLGIETPLELYAFSSPQFNAACFKPEDGRVFIMFSSSLLEAFAEKELLFVMGHELGHHLYEHHNIPIGYILRGKRPPPANLALDLFAWSRYAEVSADRAGAFCAEDMHSVARALFRLASGVTSEKVVHFNLDEFIQQVDDMVEVDAEPGQGAPMQDWFSTHPFSPLRVKALQHFHHSELMAEGGFSKHELEVKVQEVMRLMEPDYIEAKTDTGKAMRRLFVAGAIAVADAHDGVSEEEKEVLKNFFKEDSLDIDRLDADRLRDALPKRITATKKLASQAQRMQVLRDLCLIARADGKVEEPELSVLKDIAQGLDIPFAFVLQCSEKGDELD